jgi:AraC-like DNA-binding protein
MQGSLPSRREILIPPKGIVVRASSDELVVNDPLVAQAARLIRENALVDISVGDLCRKLNVSRSRLDRRMKTALKRSPKEEITRIRPREVERLLRETDITIEVIAEQTGFAHSHYLQAVLNKRMVRLRVSFAAPSPERDLQRCELQAEQIGGQEIPLCCRCRPKSGLLSRSAATPLFPPHLE